METEEVEMPKRVHPPGESRRDKNATTTIEVDRTLRHRYKMAAAQLDVTVRSLTEEALEAHWPAIAKRVKKAQQ
jgi:hypothetical protein